MNPRCRPRQKWPRQARFGDTTNAEKFDANLILHESGKPKDSIVSLIRIRVNSTVGQNTYANREEDMPVILSFVPAAEISGKRKQENHRATCSIGATARPQTLKYQFRWDFYLGLLPVCGFKKPHLGAVSKVFHCGGSARPPGMLRTPVEVYHLIELLSGETMRYGGECFPELPGYTAPSMIVEVAQEEARHGWRAGFYRLVS